jgi:hypothetical protein
MFIWWRGDHEPPHVHVFDRKGRLITRVNLRTMQPMDAPSVNPRIIELIYALQREGRL